MPYSRDYAEIRFADWRQSVKDDIAFIISMEVVGPGDRRNSVYVSFAEEFMERFFRVPWNKDLAREEDRIEKERHAFFVRLALMKTEEIVRGGFLREEVVVAGPADRDWAKQVQEGKLNPASEPVGDHTYRFPVKR